MKPYNFIHSKDRKFRHLRTIHFRNVEGEYLVNSILTISTFPPTPTKEKISKEENEKELYRSDVYESSLNPSFEFDWEIPHLKDLRETINEKFIVKLREFGIENSQVGKILVNQHMNLKKLTFFSESLNSLVFDLSLKTIVYEFVDGFFIDEKFVKEHNIPCKDAEKIVLEIPVIMNTLVLSGKKDDSSSSSSSDRSTKSFRKLRRTKSAFPTVPNPEMVLKMKKKSIDEFEEGLGRIVVKGGGASLKTPGTHQSKDDVDLYNEKMNEETNEVMEVEVKKVRVKNLEKNLNKIYELKNGIAKLNSKINTVKSRIKKKLVEKQEKMEENGGGESEIKEITRKRIKKMIEEKRKNVEKMREEIKIYKDSLVSLENNFVKSQNEVLVHIKKIKKKRDLVIPKFDENRRFLKKKIEQRRKEILKEIFEKIYLIEVNENIKKRVFKYSINGLTIYKVHFGNEKKGSGNNVNSSKGEIKYEIVLNDETSAALGYVSHCVVMISKVLQIPLIHSVIPKSSRSVIVDGNKASKNLLPLYPPKSKNERPIFYKAVDYLNENIVGLRMKLFEENERGRDSKERKERIRRRNNEISTKKDDGEVNILRRGGTKNPRKCYNSFFGKKLERNVLKNLMALVNSCIKE